MRKFATWNMVLYKAIFRTKNRLVLMNKSAFPDSGAVPAEFRISSPIEQRTALIDGNLTEIDAPAQDVCSPVAIVNGEEMKAQRLGSYPLMTPEQSMEALNAAVRAYRSDIWKSRSLEYRASRARVFLEEFVKHRDDIVKMLMWENCKSYAESISEFDRTAEYIEKTIDVALKIQNAQKREYAAGFVGIAKASPLGVVVTMGPSNYPLYETYSLCIPALLAGNCVIMKAPRYGALIHSFILEPLRKAFPRGTINVVYGKNEDTIIPIMQSGEVNVLAYMGGSMFAEPLLFAHPKPWRLKKLLGLEAKNPAIILKSADIKEAARESALGALAFNGQRCAAVKIIFAHEDIHDEFVAALKNEIESAKLGMPWDNGVRITPIFDRNRVLYLKTLLEDAIKLGAKLENENGGRIEYTLFSPALLTGVNEKMRIFMEEQFGPIVPVVKYRNIDEVIDYAYSSEYGQQASIFGGDSKEIADIANKLEYHVGRVNINSKCQRGPDIFPFTGKKNSGIGELSIRSTYLEFTTHSVIAGKDCNLSEEVLNRL
jgi:glyceraldehyde-3-phosphate dehydrogenase (NADP+)